MYTDDEILSLMVSLRHELHLCPEISEHEEVTKKNIKAFLRKYTSLEIIDCGPGFYAAHREQECTLSPIALRADYDALPVPGGKAAHLCGHDGHSSALAGAAAALEGQKVGRNVFFLWQPAEEIGTGAKACLDIFNMEKIEEIYGAHNLPGFALGQVYTRPGTFACGSLGLTISLEGKPTHAAYPELGISPATALGELLTAIPVLSDRKNYSGMTLCTVIGSMMGQKAFGKAADSAQLWLTLRAEQNSDLQLIRKRVLKLAEELADKYSLVFSFDEQDVFPATCNDEACAKRVAELCTGQLLSQPMRWSEDFGHYLMHCRGAFFGIGAGESHPGLHTADYSYPDELLWPTAEAFLKLIKNQ